MTQAYLINPETRQITPVDYAGNIESIYAHIECTCFDVATFNARGDGVFVDDEGLLKSPSLFFFIPGYPQPLAGKGLVLGVDDEGESIAPTVTLDWLKSNVRFLEHLGGGNFLDFGTSMEVN